MAHFKLRPVLIAVGIVALIVLIAGGLFVHQTLAAYQSSINSGKTAKNVDTSKPLSILLLGTDTGADGRIDKGNSDTIMVVTINPKTKKTVITSIPRDTLAEMVGDSQTNVQKLNAAYNIGGSDMAKASVSRLLNIPINYYATINMGGLKQIVNAVGGVTITSPMDVTFDNITVTKGTHHLNGKEALAYTRMRHQDPRGDYGRQLRQQQVMKAVLAKLAKTATLTHYSELLSSLKGNLKTDLSFKELVGLATHDHENTKNIQSTQLVGTPAWINTSSYQIASTKTLQATSDAIRQQLGLKKAKLSNMETKLNALNPTYDGINNLNYDTNGLDRITYTDSTN
ncbi:LytR family transcriptional regulator [Lactobacillus sp. CBA3605]|uniref:LCP family protein n=1 Tax=Lactobacillus sp. CBA3605 TaxID=2099788 RepID=UPI000CFDD5B2|nr:LCP family protein [Lactobacillus sp. CBA3605]AVK61709.1 LytR family transcriptional regulator [Lactobacillus sp. CBA3605]